MTSPLALFALLLLVAAGPAAAEGADASAPTSDFRRAEPAWRL